MTDLCDTCRQGDCGDCWVMYDRLQTDTARRVYLDRILDDVFERGSPRSEDD